MSLNSSRPITTLPSWCHEVAACIAMCTICAASEDWPRKQSSAMTMQCGHTMATLCDVANAHQKSEERTCALAGSAWTLCPETSRMLSKLFLGWSALWIIWRKTRARTDECCTWSCNILPRCFRAFPAELSRAWGASHSLQPASAPKTSSKEKRSGEVQLMKRPLVRPSRESVAKSLSHCSSILMTLKLLASQASSGIFKHPHPSHRPSAHFFEGLLSSMLECWRNARTN